MLHHESPSGTQTVTRAVHVLKLIAAHHEAGLRLVDIAAQLGLPRPTVHRLLKTLTEEGMLTRNRVTRRYTLGPLVFEMGIAAAHAFNLHDLCRPALQRLAERSGDTSFLFIRSGEDSVCLERVQGSFPIQALSVPVGSRQPLGVNAGGLALLCTLSSGETEALLESIAPRLPAYGELNADALRAIVERARRQGYALIGNRAVPGVTAVGLPIVSAAGLAIAAVTVAAPNGRMTRAHVTEVRRHLADAVGEITHALRQ